MYSPFLEAYLWLLPPKKGFSGLTAGLSDHTPSLSYWSILLCYNPFGFCYCLTMFSHTMYIWYDSSCLWSTLRTTRRNCLNVSKEVGKKLVNVVLPGSQRWSPETPIFYIKNIQEINQKLKLFCDLQQVGGGSLNCLEFGDSKLSPMEGCTGKKCPCPCQHGNETPETTDTGKITRQLSPQSINTVVAFSVVSPEIKQAIESVKYIAENMRSRNKAKEVSYSYIYFISEVWWLLLDTWLGDTTYDETPECGHLWHCSIS